MPDLYELDFEVDCSQNTDSIVSLFLEKYFLASQINFFLFYKKKWVEFIAGRKELKVSLPSTFVNREKGRLVDNIMQGFSTFIFTCSSSDNVINFFEENNYIFSECLSSYDELDIPNDVLEFIHQVSWKKAIVFFSHDASSVYIWQSKDRAH